LNAGGRSSALPEYDFDWRPRAEAQGTDIDLLRLMNLLWQDRHYPTAEIVGRNARACERRPMIFAAGGSFTVEVLINLIETPCRPVADFWHYVRHDPGVFGRGRHIVESRAAFDQETAPGMVSAANFSKALEGADVVLLEENESVIGEMGQVGDLFEATR
jgi:hypothetical protein